MDAVAVLLLVCSAVLLPAGGARGALTCFKCTVLPPPHSSNETARLCAQFDGSERFHVTCPFSTFCLKKTFELPIKGKTVAGVERDCAPQRYRYQRYDEARGRWETGDAVADAAYTPGCEAERGEAARSVKSASATYCYCRSNLCNGAARAGGGGGGTAAHAHAHHSADYAPSYTHHTDAMAVIFVFNAMKYIRSLR